MEHMTVQAGQAAACHGEGGGAAVRVAGHGLVDHNGIVESGVAVALRIIGGQVTVDERNGIFPLYAHTFGQVARQGSIAHGDIRRGIDRRGTQSVRGIAAAVHDHGAAAPVGADRRGGPAAGGDVQIIGIGGAAACGHDTPGTVACGRNGRIADDDGGAVAGGSVLTAVAAVAEYAVCAVSIRGDRSAGDGGRGTVFHQDSRVQTVEVAVVAAVRIAGFRHSRIRDRDFIRSRDQQGALVSSGTGVGLAALRISGSNLNRRCVIDI